jgi:hypothetical protein
MPEFLRYLALTTLAHSNFNEILYQVHVKPKHSNQTDLTDKTGGIEAQFFATDILTTEYNYIFKQQHKF